MPLRGTRAEVEVEVPEEGKAAAPREDARPMAAGERMLAPVEEEVAWNVTR